MNDTHATLEVIAPTIEEAIAKGLSELGLPEEAVEIEILDEGSKGLFGLGSRQSRIRLSIKSTPQSVEADTNTPASRKQKDSAAGSIVLTDESEELVEQLDTDEGGQKASAAPLMTLGEEEEIILQVARDTVDELLQRMHVRASVTSQFGETDDVRGRTPVLVDISGKDLSILIGRQAETLNALQYIAALIVSKEIGHSLTLVIDVQGYRKRRDQQLRQLARRMADQAMKTGRRQVLEPMPASERRIIHIELREHPEVTTESIGEEPRRKVTIVPKS
jgi:spoIIIJ-associated protein